MGALVAEPVPVVAVAGVEAVGDERATGARDAGRLRQVGSDVFEAGTAGDLAADADDVVEGVVPEGEVGDVGDDTTLDSLLPGRDDGVRADVGRDDLLDGRLVGEVAGVSAGATADVQDVPREPI